VTHLAYLATVLLSIGCVGLVDRRWGLVLWAHAGRAVVVLGSGVAVFLVWDLVALDHGFYRRGGAEVMTGVELAPGLPLEELFFVLFLCYLTLVLHRGTARLLRAGRPARVVRR
jgi:lycopene cyclase domain-containing protein